MNPEWNHGFLMVTGHMGFGQYGSSLGFGTGLGDLYQLHRVVICELIRIERFYFKLIFKKIASDD